MSSSAPRRRQSPAVYRRRRLAVLLIAVLLIGGIVWLVAAQPWSSPAADPAGSTESPATSATPQDSSSPAPSGTPSSEAPVADASGEPVPVETTGVEACTSGDLLVEAVTDQSSYAQGQNPQLSIRLTNKSPADCTLNVGTSAQAFTVSSGSDVWWRSTDCQKEPSDMVVVLTAGQVVTSSAPLTWDRTRSSVDTCQSERPTAPGGGATYHLSVAINGISSTNTASFQLR